MKHNLWDRMMYRLLQEKKEKEVKASKSKGAKPDFLDLDKDGDKEEPMSKASKEAGGKKDAPKAKKGKGKIPPQLRMYIQKKKKSKLDEAIDRLEKILFEGEGDIGSSRVEEIDRDQYARDTGNVVRDFTEIEDLEPLLKDSEFSSKEMVDGSNSKQVQDFTYGNKDGSKILPLKKTDKAFYFKTNDDKYYMVPTSENSAKTMQDTESGDMDEEQADAMLEEYNEDRYPPMKEEDDEELDDPMDEGIEEYLTEAEVKKKQPRLGKVTRNPAGSKKKFHVYVKCGGRVKKISFGDPGLSIKRDSAARRKNFRARHKCDKPAGKDRCTARYWSCYQWRAGKKVEGEE